MLAVTFCERSPPSQPTCNFADSKRISFRNAHASVPKHNFSTGSPLFSRNVRWIACRRKFNAKPTNSEIGTDQATQLPQEEITVSRNGNNPSTSFLSLLCPLLRLFNGSDPSKNRNNVLEVATSSLSTLARYPWGSRSLSNDQELAKEEPPMCLQLFEFEACPFCRRVREAMTELDLSVEVYPCPKGSLRHREMVKSYGGKEQFPFLIDPNTGVSMYESGDIVKYLFQQYGGGRSPSFGLLESTLLTGWMPTILRAGRGMMLWDKARLEPPPKKLELFSFENNPVPYLVDPNTGTQASDYKKILSYLFETYSSEK